MNADHLLDSVPGINVFKESKSMLIKVASIGLSSKANIILKTTIKLSPKLKQNFVFLPEAQAPQVSVVLVNADKDESIYAWLELERSNPQITAVWVYRKKRPADARHRLKLPINEKRLKSALFRISPSGAQTDKLNIFEYRCALKLLVVDDSISVRKYMHNKLSEVCQGKKIYIDFAESGEKAFDNIKKAPMPYDLIFIDVMLRDLNGYQVCRWIKKFSAKTTVVMLSRRDSILDKMRSNISGCDSCLSKPPRDKDLTRVIHKFNLQTNIR